MNEHTGWKETQQTGWWTVTHWLSNPRGESHLLFYVFKRGAWFRKWEALEEAMSTSWKGRKYVQDSGSPKGLREGNITKIGGQAVEGSITIRRGLDWMLQQRKPLKPPWTTGVTGEALPLIAMPSTNGHWASSHSISQTTWHRLLETLPAWFLLKPLLLMLQCLLQAPPPLLQMGEFF